MTAGQTRLKTLPSHNSVSGRLMQSGVFTVIFKSASCLTGARQSEQEEITSQQRQRQRHRTRYTTQRSVLSNA